MNIPTDYDIHQLYTQYHTPDHIQAHMAKVAELGQQIAQTQLQIGMQVNVELVVAAALLHDLVRIKEQWQYLPANIATPLPHAEINYLVLCDRWLEVATTIRPHSLMTILQDDPFANIEQKIVYYADKRVNHSTVVSLADRLRLGQERWQVQSQQDRTAELFAKLTALEQELFTHHVHS